MEKKIDQTDLTFEDALHKLEIIVLELEKEDVPLEKAIKYYEQGMKLTQLCDQMLKEAEETMTKVLTENDELTSFHIEEE